MVWIVDEEKVFSINNDLDISIKKVGNDKVVIVDNFYKDPDAVRHLIMNTPATNWRFIINNLPGARNLIGLNTTTLRDVSSFLSEKFFKTQVFDLNYFTGNLFIQKDKPAGINCIPHTDPYYISGLVYMNTPEECRGGTAFYKNKHTGSQYNTIPPPFESRDIYKDFLTESNENWEILDVIEMKYNRYLLYPANIYHSPYIMKDWFHDYYRINQVFYFLKVLNDSSILSLVKEPVIEDIVEESGEKYTHIQIHDFPISKFKDFNTNALMDLFSLMDGQRPYGQIRSIIESSYNLNQTDISNLKKIFTELITSKTVISYNG